MVQRVVAEANRRPFGLETHGPPSRATQEEAKKVECPLFFAFMEVVMGQRTFVRRSRCGVLLAAGIACAALVGGCNQPAGPASANGGKSLAEIIGEPVAVTEDVAVDVAEPAVPDFGPRPRKMAGAGNWFVIVTLKVTGEKAFVTDDYSLRDERGTVYPLVGVSAGLSSFERRYPMYTLKRLGKSLKVRPDPEGQESFEIQGKGPEAEAEVTGWTLPAGIVALWFETPQDAPGLLLRHGTRQYALDPKAGTIDGKQPEE
jgi:hypothetical protein